MPPKKAPSKITKTKPVSKKKQSKEIIQNIQSHCDVNNSDSNTNTDATNTEPSSIRKSIKWEDEMVIELLTLREETYKNLFSKTSSAAQRNSAWTKIQLDFHKKFPALGIVAHSKLRCFSVCYFLI